MCVSKDLFPTYLFPSTLFFFFCPKIIFFYSDTFDFLVLARHYFFLHFCCCEKFRNFPDLKKRKNYSRILPCGVSLLRWPSRPLYSRVTFDSSRSGFFKFCFFFFHFDPKFHENHDFFSG